MTQARRARDHAGPAAAILALLGAFSLYPLALAFRLATARHGVASGADGPFVADQFQYFAWIRDSGNHVLVGNRYDLVPERFVFLHPMFVVSGWLWKAGVDIRLAYLLWKPVAVVMLLVAAFVYCRRLLQQPAEWFAAALVLFLYSPTAAVVQGVGLPVGDVVNGIINGAGELFAAGLLWGYLPAAIAVALMPLVLLGAERTLAGGPRSRRDLLLTSLGALLVAWLHPWQGEVLLLVMAGGLAWTRAGRAAFRLLLPAACLTLPLLYYLALSLFDPAWHVAQAQNSARHLSDLGVLLAALPLMVLALTGARRPADFQEAALVVWIPAALVLYFIIRPPFAQHALEGLSFPAAVLGVRGVRRFGPSLGASPRLAATAAVLAVAPLTVPGLVAMTRLAPTRTADRQPVIFTQDEFRALAFLQSAPSGGVLSGTYLGQAVPAFSDKSTWAGHISWTPEIQQRQQRLRLALSGTDPGATTSLAIDSGARYVLLDCRQSETVDAALAELTVDSRRFGCVRVLTLRPAASATAAAG
jgi:hypothetical protein